MLKHYNIILSLILLGNLNTIPKIPKTFKEDRKVGSYIYLVKCERGVFEYQPKRQERCKPLNDQVIKEYLKTK